MIKKLKKNIFQILILKSRTQQQQKQPIYLNHWFVSKKYIYKMNGSCVCVCGRKKMREEIDERE
jgi:hypothetical protein